MKLASKRLAAIRHPETPEDTRGDLELFIERERDELCRRWRTFAPVVLVLVGLSELASRLTPEFPPAPIATLVVMASVAGVWILARRQPSRATIGWASAALGIICAGYIGIASAGSGRFHSLQILAMTVLISLVPAMLSMSLAETITALGGGIVAWVLVTRFYRASGAVDYEGLATGLTYLVFLSLVTVLAVHNNRRLRLRELKARREVERVHRFAVEEVLCRHLPPRYVERVLSGEHPLDSPPERRVVTVVFADLVSFTPLSEALAPEELALLMARFYDLTATSAFAEGATIDKFIGDAAMALLGAPESMGPDEQARRAVAVARAWHRAVGEVEPRRKSERRLALRIGIHQDVVAVGAFGGRLRSDYTVLGRGVNIAARLEQRCPSGAILISGEVRRWLDPEAVPAEDLGELSLKGIPSPVRCFLLRSDEA